MGRDLHVFALDETGRVPESPGLYAWYLRPPAPLPTSVDEETGRDHLLEQLLPWVEAFRVPVPQLLGDGHFEQRWTAEISASGIQDVLRKLRECEVCRISSTCSDHSNQSRQFIELLDDQPRREALVEILETLGPLLMPPIYVGIAENLRRRIRTHKRDMSRQGDRNTFGGRIAASGADLNRLLVAVMPVNGSHLSTRGSTINTHLEALEWILNRAFTPYFGRK
jgi:hypothetical protein